MGGEVALEPTVYVFNATTGDEITKCSLEGSVFMNDVTVHNGKAYATDSLVNRITEIDVDSATTGECVMASIEIPAEIFAAGNGTKANGKKLYNVTF